MSYFCVTVKKRLHWLPILKAKVGSAAVLHVHGAKCSSVLTASGTACALEKGEEPMAAE